MNTNPVRSRSQAQLQVNAALEQFPEDVAIKQLCKFAEELNELPNEPRLEPLKLINKQGRPSNSTKRLPSKFEVVEKEFKAKARAQKRKASEAKRPIIKKQKVRDSHL